MSKNKNRSNHGSDDNNSNSNSSKNGRNKVDKNDNSDQSNLTSTFDINPTQTQGSNGSAELNLILFDEVDTVFEEDSGLYSAIQQLARTSKCPIVLTSQVNIVEEGIRHPTATLVTHFTA